MSSSRTSWLPTPRCSGKEVPIPTEGFRFPIAIRSTVACDSQRRIRSCSCLKDYCALSRDKQSGGNGPKS